ncbi:hypothetical protein D5S19_13055 [Amycolatopsis panacis]|uniref:Uncharacterized protein n=2 Tax=Amycolatopsis panacis TaxID=2340917 RepID=A0A419I552_9PSEU|nr:hypothetical protein D5S19_13055 [Amycolatopsis panacis]
MASSRIWRRLAHSNRVTEILDTAHRALNQYGASPDRVGEQVLGAVGTNAPYLATRDQLADHLRERTVEIAAAMTHAERFLSGVDGSDGVKEPAQ